MVFSRALWRRPKALKPVSITGRASRDRRVAEKTKSAGLSLHHRPGVCQHSWRVEQEELLCGSHLLFALVEPVVIGLGPPSDVAMPAGGIDAPDRLVDLASTGQDRSALAAVALVRRRCTGGAIVAAPLACRQAWRQRSTCSTYSPLPRQYSVRSTSDRPSSRQPRRTCPRPSNPLHFDSCSTRGGNYLDRGGDWTKRNDPKIGGVKNLESLLMTTACHLAA